MRNRIDKFGVAQPSIQKQAFSGRIMIELPGVKDKDRVRRVLQSTANLEFWETYNNDEFYGFLNDANTKLAARAGAIDTTAKDTTATDTAAAASPQAAAAATDTSATADTLAQDTLSDEAQRAKFRRENPLFAVLTPPMVRTQNGFNLSRGWVVGVARESDTAQVNRLLRDPLVKASLPNDCKLAWAAKSETIVPNDGSAPFKQLALYALKFPRGSDGKPLLDGSAVVNAVQDFNMKGEVEVVMQMNPEGAQTWKQMTGANVGRGIAIVLDDLVYSAPVVQGEIPGGRSSITMGRGENLNRQIQEADDLANILKAGALPAPARIIEETVVGPTLGAENVNTGMRSFALALLLVLVYMVLYYARAGWVADLALVVNLFVLLGALASLQAALTLPGIAGIVLTMGMAVDANVLIYERIREELRAGKMIKSAVDLGYKGAFSAIIDSNVTTLIIAVILLLFGSGPVKGFATTLGLGILTSLFTALFLSRMIITQRLDKGRPFTLWNTWSRNVLVNTNFNFMGKRRIYYFVSGAIIAVGLFSMVTNGFNWSVDFSGGRTYVVKFAGDVRVDNVRDVLTPSFRNDDGTVSTPNVKTYGGARQVKVTTNFLFQETGTEVDAVVEGRLREGLDKLGLGYEVVESRKVDPTISDDIKVKAVTSLIIALVFIFLYIAVRFRNWQFGLGGLVSLAHDVLVVLGLYSLLWKVMPFSMEIDEAFIAAILTVIGYSINDTVVVFDRIREYLRDHKRDPIVVVFNKAINATLSRTINTSLTTLLVLAVIFVLGGVAIKGFVFALLVGILVGTYSSVFVAGSVTVDLLKGKDPARTA
jgi:SecD/SecF fusion protein